MPRKNRDGEYIEESKSLMGGITTRCKSIFRRRNPSEWTLKFYLLGGAYPVTVLHELFMYLLLQTAADQGHISAATPNVVFITISVLEFVTAPFLGWMFRRRPVFAVACSLASIVTTTLPLLFVLNGFPGGSAAIARNIMVILGIAVTACARNVVMIHGLSAINVDYSKDISTAMAMPLIVRAVITTTGKFMLAENLESSSLVMKQLIISTVLMSIKSAVLFIFIKDDVQETEKDDEERADDEGTSYLSSLLRVFTNKSLMAHVIAMGLFVAAIWGLLFNRSAIYRSKYHVPEEHMPKSFAWGTIASMVVVDLLVKRTSIDISSPVMERFEPKSVASKAMLFSIVTVALVAIQTWALGCSPHGIEGLTATNYNVPSCGGIVNFTLADADKFNPVCIVDTMKSYYNPYHAGCNVTNINGTETQSNCLCSGVRAVPALSGACGAATCSGAVWLHMILEAGLLALAVSTVLASVTSVVRAHAGSPAPAVGVACGALALLAFGAGHTLFMTVGAWTCVRESRGVCQLQNSSYHQTLGSISVGLLVTAGVIYFCIFRFSKRKSS